MSHDRRFEEASIAEQAALWWSILNDDESPLSDQQEFCLWVARSPERVEAYLRIVQVMRTLKSSATRWPDVDSDTLIRAAQITADNVVAHDPQAAYWGRSVGICDNPKRRPRNFWGVKQVCAAALATLLIAGWVAWGWAHSHQFLTEPGEQRSILLSDGSRVTLNTATKIEVHFGSKRRVVRLINGEALFAVAHDRLRPFDVLVRDARVRAVGTEFNVKLHPDRTTVTVVEGRVAVDAQGAIGNRDVPVLPPPEPRQESSTVAAVTLPLRMKRWVSTAERIDISRAGITNPVPLKNVGADTAWTERKLIFDHTPLSEVAEEFNRYNRRTIVIEPAGLERQAVTGVFQTDDPAPLLAFLSRTPGVKVIESDSSIRVTSTGR